MSGPTVRISATSRQVLRTLAKQTGKAMQTILDEAVEAYRRKVFLDAVNAGYAELRADPEAWAEHCAERHLWDATAADGLEPEKRPEANGKTRPKKGKG